METVQVNVLTNKKEYEIMKILETVKNIKVDSYYIVRYEKKGDKNILVIKRGVSTGYPTSTKWELFVDNNNIIAEKKKTFDQMISCIFVVLYAFISAVIFAVLVFVSIVSMVKGHLHGISIAEMISVLSLEIVAIISVMGYKHVYYSKPKEVLKKYLEKYLV